jgi:hypothetical protein
LLELRGHIEAQCLRRLQVDYEFIFSRRLHGQFAGILALQNAAEIGCSSGADIKSVQASDCVEKLENGGVPKIPQM